MSWETIWDLSGDLVLMKLSVSWSLMSFWFSSFFVFFQCQYQFLVENERPQNQMTLLKRTLIDHRTVSLLQATPHLKKTFLTGCCLPEVWKLSQRSGRNATACLFSVSLLNKLWVCPGLNFSFKILTNVLMIS